jgi:hypothetical protein
MSGTRNCTAEAAAKAPIRTLKFKVRSQSYPWLNAAAVETNQVWNFFNATRVTCQVMDMFWVRCHP